MADKDNIFFVEVRDPVVVRRLILESLKDILESLQRFEKFKEIRKEKLAKIETLRKVVKDVNKNIGALKAALPEAKVRAFSEPVKQKKVAKKAKKKTKGKKAAAAPKQVQQQLKPMSEIDKLASELTAIESKLQQL